MFQFTLKWYEWKLFIGSLFWQQPCCSTKTINKLNKFVYIYKQTRTQSCTLVQYKWNLMILSWKSWNSNAFFSLQFPKICLTTLIFLSWWLLWLFLEFMLAFFYTVHVVQPASQHLILTFEVPRQFSLQKVKVEVPNTCIHITKLLNLPNH